MDASVLPGSASISVAAQQNTVVAPPAGAPPSLEREMLPNSLAVESVDLEIGLYYRDAESYTVELRFRDPDAQTDEPASRGPAQFDFEKLREDQRDALAYGQRLTNSLFADTQVRDAFKNACRDSLNAGKALRLHLYIAPEVPELYNLHWEK